MIKFGFVSFVLSGLLLVTTACPHFSRLTQFTWFGAAQTQLHLYGFFAITMFGAIYYILPRAVGIEFAFPKLIRVQHWFAMLGIVILVVSLAAGGVAQGLKLNDPNVAFADSTKAMLPFLRASTHRPAAPPDRQPAVRPQYFCDDPCLEMVGGQGRVRRRDGALGKSGGESMKNGFVIFLAAFVLLGSSWGAFVLAPQLQLGGAKQVPVLNSSEVYPVNRPGEANQGLQIYRANGCAACHTEQVQQDGVVCNVVLTAPGKNPSVVSNLMATLKLTGLTEQEAEAASGKITTAGGKVETHIVAVGPDIARGWGLRHSVAEDFLYDNPVQLGGLRVGPDLADVGARLPDANWQLLHLYAPRSVVKDSAMPPFRYLFRIQKIGGAPSPDALNLPKAFAPAAGYEVVPKPAAKELAAYLLSLHADVPLYDAPFTPPAAAKP